MPQLNKVLKKTETPELNKVKKLFFKNGKKRKRINEIKI